MKIMQARIRLSPYDPYKRLRLVIDGAKTLGTGFLLIQYLNDVKPEIGVNIIHAGSGLLDPEKDYSPVEAEAIALDRAISACHYWLYYCKLQLISVCQGLLGLMEKNLADVDNKKLQKILETASNYRWELTLISGEENKICDALSRLCTKICFNSHTYIVRSLRLLQTSKKATIRNKQLERDDPLVMKIAEEANMDLEYIEIMTHIDTEFVNIPPDSKLKQLIDVKDTLRIWNETFCKR